MKSIEHWSRSPILLPRWALLVMYGLFAMLGAATLLRGAPTLEVTVSDRTQLVLAAIVTASAIVAAVASIADPFELVEAWACVGIIIGMSGYIVSALIVVGVGGSLFPSVLLTFITSLAVARWWPIRTSMGIRRRVRS